MGGFMGVLLNEGLHFNEEHLRDIESGMNLLKHRGSGEKGIYHDSHISFASHQRTNNGGAQPFPFDNERYWLVFDGKIYNKIPLQAMLMNDGHEFETQSDEELIANLFKAKGVNAFSALRGMFAIVIWDTEKKRLYGARDPFGIKPFYYQENDQEFIFASEKKSIALLNNDETVDQEALQHYLSFQYVPDPLTLTGDVFRLAPGQYFTKSRNEPLQKQRYFHATLKPVQANENQMIQRIQEVLFDSVKAHLKSDTPIGSFLSGGIDSTLLVSIAKQVDPNFKTFSVGFDMEGYSEVDVAKKSAEAIGVENISRIISADEYVDKLPEIIWRMDEPLADPSCVPLYFVSQEARKHVGSVLSGEGADELFGGYNIYREADSLRYFRYLPKGLNQAINRVATILPDGMKGKSFLERGTTPLSERYIGNAKMFEECEKSLLLKNYCSKSTYQTWTSNLYDQVKDAHPVQQMQYIDIHTWLPGDILVKADKMASANGLEIRVPFLDKDVFEVARSIPMENKIADGTTKSILRKAARGIAPDHILDRKKLGFPVPLKHWLRKELYLWADNLIRTSNTDHLINKAFVLELLDQHGRKNIDHSRKIWTVLVFMLWHQIYVERMYSFDGVSKEENPERQTS